MPLNAYVTLIVVPVAPIENGSIFKQHFHQLLTCRSTSLWDYFTDGQWPFVLGPAVWGTPGIWRVIIVASVGEKMHLQDKPAESLQATAGDSTGPIDSFSAHAIQYHFIFFLFWHLNNLSFSSSLLGRMNTCNLACRDVKPDKYRMSQSGLIKFYLCLNKRFTFNKSVHFNKICFNKAIVSAFWDVINLLARRASLQPCDFLWLHFSFIPYKSSFIP